MFKVRDLLIVAAVALGVFGGIYRSEVVGFARNHAAPVVTPVLWYVDAPAREARLEARLVACEAVLAVAQDDLKSAREQMASDATQRGQVLSAVKAQIAVAEGERDRLFGELAGLKTRYATLCQRLLELGNDVPSALAAE